MNQHCPALPAAWAEHLHHPGTGDTPPHTALSSGDGHLSLVPRPRAGQGVAEPGMCRAVKEQAQHLSCCPRDSWSSQNLLSIPGGKQTASSSLKIAAQGTRSRLREGEVKRKMGCSFPRNSPQPCSPSSSRGDELQALLQSLHLNIRDEKGSGVRHWQPQSPGQGHCGVDTVPGRGSAGVPHPRVGST